MLRVHTDVFMKVYWYSINSVTTMVVTCGVLERIARGPEIAIIILCLPEPLGVGASLE